VKLFLLSLKKFAYSKTFFTFAVFFVIFSHQLQSQGIIPKKEGFVNPLFCKFLFTILFVNECLHNEEGTT
ncbi:MAG: hypothetical protein ACI4OP_02960, partial [Candidatus Coprovivens sp.]